MAVPTGEGPRRSVPPRGLTLPVVNLAPFPWSPLGVATGALSVLLAGLAWWGTHPPDPMVELRARSFTLEQLERGPAPETGRGVERWRMIAAGGDTVAGLWKPAGTSARFPTWSMVILGGVGTDDRAALLVPDSLPIGVLAVSWPWKGPRRMGKLEFLASLPKIREAVLRTPAAIALGAAAVRRACPGTRVALLGASLGAPPTVAALALTAPEALVVVDGAADLARLLRSETSRALGGGLAAAVLAPPAGALGARLLWSIEPARHPTFPGTPVLLVDAAREERYPRECVARLHAMFPGASIGTHPQGHMQSGNRPVVAAIVDTVWRWLDALPERPAAPSTVRWFRPTSTPRAWSG